MFGNILGKVKLPGGVSIGANFPIGTDPFKGKKQPGVGGEDSTPQNGINRMMANVKRGGLFSRPYLYYVFITPPKTLLGADVGDIRGVMLNCHTCSIPGFTMATKEHKPYGLKREYVYEKLFDTMNMTFYVSEEMHEHNFFNSWMGTMWDRGRVNWYRDYVSTIEIFQCAGTKPGNGDGDDLPVMMKVKLIDAYPKVLGALPLGYGTAGTIQNLPIDFTFRDIEYTDYKGGNPVNKLLSSLSDGFTQAQNALSSFTEVGSQLGGLGKSLSMPKIGSILKQKSQFLPISKLGGMFV
jgi:hypothetical protein